jgi:hypothetical protein
LDINFKKKKIIVNSSHLHPILLQIKIQKIPKYKIYNLKLKFFYFIFYYLEGKRLMWDKNLILRLNKLIYDFIKIRGRN